MSLQQAKECAHCGSCTVVCPVFRVTGRESLTARGKLHLLSSGLGRDPSVNFQNLFSMCLLCGACEASCSRSLPIRTIVAQARSGFSFFHGPRSLQRAAVRLGLSRPNLLAALVRAGLKLADLDLLPRDSGLRLRLGLLQRRPDPEEAEEGGSRPVGRVDAGGQDAVYFSGCLARYIQPAVATATERLYRRQSGKRLVAPPDQACCGLAARAAGRVEEARGLARRNIAAFEVSTGPVLTSCASCFAHLLSYPELLEDDPAWHARARAFSARVREFSGFFRAGIVQASPEAGEPLRLHYHEPCHLRFDENNRQATRDILDRIGNITRTESEETSGCCGQGGLFHIAHPDLSGRIFDALADATAQAAPDLVVTTCSGCLLQWQEGLAARKSRTRGVHLAVFLGECCADTI